MLSVFALALPLEEAPRVKERRDESPQQEALVLEAESSEGASAVEASGHQKLYTLAQLNKLYKEGRPSNDVTEAGLLVHQHDNTEGVGAMVYEASNEESKDFFATSIVNMDLSGLYNKECGVVIAPSTAEVLCSYYADMTSWSTGCDTDYLATSGWHDPKAVSKVRETPYPAEELAAMMEMSHELQSNKTALMNYRTARVQIEDGDGEPDTGEDDFWLGQYNEVLIDKAQYVSNLPWSVAALFHVENGDADGCSCLTQTKAAMVARYGSDAEHVLLLKHTPGASKGFELADCAEQQAAEDGGCVSIMPGIEASWCVATCATGSCPENMCKNCD